MKDVTPQNMRCAMVTECPAIIEVTPQDMRCAIGASCPAIFDVTPEPMACALGESCPAIYETQAQDGHIIIGKIMGFAPQTADRDAMLSGVPEEIRQRIGPDEFAIWVPKGMVKPGDAA